MTTGIISYGAYVPRARLRSETVREALGTGRAGRTRAVAGCDEDTTTMAVEAARRALRELPADSVGAVSFSSAHPVYAAKTNATAVHAALSLPAHARAVDRCGPERSALGALLDGFAGSGTHLVALADTVVGPAGGADEIGGGDGAAAFVLGGAAPVAVPLGTGAATAEFLDRWNAPGETFARTWEERFGQEAYTRLGAASVARALEDAGLAPSEVTSWAVTGLSERAARQLGRSTGLGDVRTDDLTSVIGRVGSAHAGILLADMLDRARPGDVLALTLLADGADTLVLRVTEAITAHRRRETTAAQIAAGDDQLAYATFLTWKGLLERPAPRRPEPARISAPASLREARWKYGFTGARCDACATRHMPPQRVCLRCGASGRMKDEPLADVAGTLATYTVDHLAYSPAPPVIGVVIDFDGGGRFACELTDADPEAVAIGDRVQMTFRRIGEADGIVNYFWKARPLSEEAS
ncbi:MULTISPECIES: OB-fold domain-containing protein [Brevibacterium]|uniref:Hydroxymethylglutaryl-CoA synthase family protein n=1 Tax=Brevibacterium salitolerans TaxID=1403566 RepID=A0ABP5IDB2_9MICO|nr:OB-fold domain-containing protein [Brevibacterium sp.]